VFVLGHSVVGPKLVRLIKPALPWGWLVLGGLLPDLIDKPLYYGLVFTTGRRAADLGLISGTRTFGHTALFLLTCAIVALVVRKTGHVAAAAALAALTWGVASHHFLDNLGDLPGRFWGTSPEGVSTLDGFLFPLRGAHFPVSPFRSVREHLFSATRLYVLAGEVTGAALLVRAWWQRRRRAGAEERQLTKA
jgi:hypothetical protein